jgi:hypothetical protein
MYINVDIMFYFHLKRKIYKEIQLKICMPFKENPVYARPEVVKRIYDLRTGHERWRGIATKILEEFDLKITEPTVKNIYDRFVAKNMLVQGVKEGKLAQEIVPDFQKKMEERFDRVVKVTDELMDILEEFKKNMPPVLYVKFVPTILMVCREILNQLNFIKKEQSQVLVNQKNLIYSPLQIMNQVNQQITQLEKEGKIKILEVAKNGRVLSPEEKDHIVFSKIKTEEEIELENEPDEED